MHAKSIRPATYPSETTFLSPRSMLVRASGQKLYAYIERVERRFAGLFAGFGNAKHAGSLFPVGGFRQLIRIYNYSESLRVEVDEP